MKRLIPILFIALLTLPSVAFGQLYNSVTANRPRGLNWQQIKTEHFRIIFPNAEEEKAYRAAAILESQYDPTSDLTGGSLKNFPVILTNYNDLSNGFVTPINFRSEIDLAPLKGKGMNPQSGSWLETVLPHELVHAVHFNIQQPWSEKKPSISNFVSVFSPDIARSIHSFPPLGVHEGLAVHYETESIKPNGGRGNYTYFNHRFNANFGGSNRWGMGQTLIPTDYTRPGNRHYLAGYAFTNWLHENYGDDVSREAIRFHYHTFFLGYGMALYNKTGKWPGQLYDEYEKDLEKEEEKRLNRISINTTEKSSIIETPYKGEEIHGPKWVSDEKLMFYGSFYNARLGFYEYDFNTGDVDLLEEVFTVGDYNYEINEDGTLYFANYRRHPLYEGVYNPGITKLDLGTGKTEKVTEKDRIYGPTSNGEKVLAIQHRNSKEVIVEVDISGNVEMVKEFEEARPINLKFNPENPNQLAVILKKRGVQALWITSVQHINEDLEKAPDVAFKDASIHDPSWHPNGNKILFTMDAPPAMNIYEYDLNTGNTTQLTSSLYNAFEASYSPDGQRIAYIIQADEERKLAVLDKSNFLGEPVSDSPLMSNESYEAETQTPELGDSYLESIEGISKKSYSSDLSWLKPRAIYPVFRENANTPQYGAAVSSIDALSSQAYTAEVTGIQNRLWYDFTYTNRQFYPGFQLNAYSDPSFFAVQLPNSDTFSLMRQDRGLSLVLPFEYVFRGDTRFSSIVFEPEIGAEQFKYYNLQAEELSDFATRYKAGFYSQLSMGILNLARDVQPSSGISAFGIFEQTLNEPTAEISFPNGNVNRNFAGQWSAYYGVFGFLSPLRKWNQSLRIDLQMLSQSDPPVYSNSTIIPMGFGDGAFPNFNSDNNTGFQNIGRISTRYTIPLFYPDNGGLTLPLYLSSIYLTTFSHTLTDMDANNLIESSRSIFGGGFHVQFKVSNLLFDLGVGLAYEPSRENIEFIFGQF